MLIPVSKMEHILRELLRKHGATEEETDELTSHLITSDLYGQESHGVLRLPWYIGKLKRREIVPGAPIDVERESPSSAVVNGNWGFGQTIAKYAMNLAIEKAEKQVISCVTVRNCNHIGRVGAYTSLAPRRGMVGIGMANLHGTSHVAAPFGGIDAKLPTNPVSIAFPGGDSADFLMDMSSSVTSEGKLRSKFNKKETLPEGLIIDSDGEPSRDPARFYNAPRGALLPLGGISAHKGFALSLAIDVMSGALSGAQCSNPGAKRHGNACCFIALRIDAFTPPEEFKKQVMGLEAHVKSSRSADGSEGIFMPGEPELRHVQQVSKEGIDIDEVTWGEICSLAKEVDLEIGQHAK